MMQIKKNIALSNTGFVFNPTTGDSYTINQVGQEILGYLGDHKTVDEITSLMTSAYDIDPASFEKYFFDFISMLRQFELLDESYEK
jgi:hypothetical protein